MVSFIKLTFYLSMFESKFNANETGLLQGLIKFIRQLYVFTYK